MTLKNLANSDDLQVSMVSNDTTRFSALYSVEKTVHGEEH